MEAPRAAALPERPAGLVLHRIAYGFPPGHTGLQLMGYMLSGLHEHLFVFCKGS